MTGRIIDLTRRETAASVRDRIDALTAKIEQLRPLRLKWEALEADDLSDEAWEVLEECQKVEGDVLKLALDPELAAFLACIRDQLADIAKGRPCVGGEVAK